MPRRHDPERPVTASGAGAVSAGRDITGDVTTYVGGGRGAPLGLAESRLAKVFDLVRVEDFTGRTWLLAELDAFLREEDGGYFVVEAEAGLGKSTFAAWLVADRGYPGHFTRLAGGTTARNALLNLSAQLIRAHDLFEDLEDKLHLPSLDRSLVPEWAGEPDGFDSLLHVAAQKTAGRIVLVVDGLDEESTPSTPVPLGLPSGLPDNVYVVATCRTGTPVPDAHTTVRPARIAADDPRNLADMRDYVTAAARAPELAARLATMGTSAAEFAAAVTERCGGVWIYAAHLLPDFRSGELAIGDVGKLPAKLSQYFAANLNSKRAGPHWATEDLSLLGALGAAAEPVHLATLSAWTGIGQAAVRQACMRRYRAFLRVGARKVAVYHRSLTEFLSGHTADQQALASTVDLIDEVSEQVATAHDDIATYYLAEFRRDPASFADLHDGYGRRFLPAHLRSAGRHRDLRVLLSPGSGWPRTGEAYAADLAHELARAAAKPDATDEAFRFEVFASLYFAGASSTPGDVPVDLVDPLLTWRVWTVDEAMAHLDQMRNPALVATGLLALADHLPAADRQRAVAAAAAHIEQVGNVVDAIRVGARLPELPKSVVESILGKAFRIGEPGEKGRTLLALMATGPFTDSLFADALEYLRDEPDAETRALGLAEAVRYAPPDQAEVLIAESLAAVENPRSVVLDGDLEIALPTDLSKRDAVLAVLLAGAPAASRPALAEELLASPRGGGYEGVGIALVLARHVPTSRREMVHDAVELARGLPDPRQRASAMVRVYDFLAAVS